MIARIGPDEIRMPVDTHFDKSLIYEQELFQFKCVFMLKVPAKYHG